MSPARPRKEPSKKVALDHVRVTTRLGDAVRLARQRRQWSLERLASEAGLSRAGVWKIETGQSTSVLSYLRLAAVLGLEATFQLESRRRAHRTEDEDPVHAAMGEVMARHLRPLGHEIRIDEPYQHYQFAGRADLIAIDQGRSALLHLEHRTRLPNLGEAAGSFNAKCTWLAAGVADRDAIPRFRSETHVLVLLWSAEIVHTLRLRADTLRALAPQGADPFERWWAGDTAQPGIARGLIVFDPIDRGGRVRRWVGLEEARVARSRYRGYADALEALRAAGLA